MDDTEALKQIDDILSGHTTCTGCHTCRMLRHNRQAIMDREALVEEYRFIGYNAVVEKAKGHMRGEK